MLFSPGIQVERYEDDNLLVSTIQATDHDGYETAIAHPDYNDGALIIVECYDSEDEARMGHAKWPATMTTKELPDVLTDNPCDFFGDMLFKVLGASPHHVRVRKLYH